MNKILLAILLSLITTFAWSTLPIEESRTVKRQTHSHSLSSNEPRRFINKQSPKLDHKLAHFPNRATNSHQIEKQRLSNNCSIAEAVATPSDELIDFLLQIDDECVSNYFYGDAELLSNFYTLDRMLTIAEGIKQYATGYSLNESESLERLIAVYRAGFFNQFYEPERYQWDDFTPSIRTATLTALNEFYGSSLFWTRDNDAHARAVYEWFILIDSSELRVEFIPMFKELLSRFDESFIQTHWWAAMYNDLFYQQIGRGVHRQRFIDAIKNDSSFMSLLEQATTRTWLLDIEEGYYNYLFFNTFFYIGKMHGFNLFHERAQNVLENILDNEERFSYLWMSVARSINGWSDCKGFTDYNICKDSVKPELESLLFPNTFSFDDGKMQVRTGLDLKTIEPLYYAAKQVQAQFFRLTENDSPIANDTNEVLTMVIYDSPESYDLYQYFLNELDTDNGGIYIEQDGTFYTYDRTPEDSIYTLEELFRHEYSHYLQARFSIHGIFGETPFYENNRLTWLNEGSAEFLAHSTQHSGVLQRATIVKRIANDTERLSISTIVNSGYNDGFKFYRYAALLVHFLNDHHNQLLTNLLKAIRNNDLDAYDTLIQTLASDQSLETDYQAYLTLAIENLENLNNPSTIYVASQSVDFDTVSIVEELILTTSLPIVECEEFAESIERRVRCRGELISESNNFKSTFNHILDESIQQLLAVERNFNWVNLVCWYGEIDSETETYKTDFTCETSIRTEGTERVNISPTISIEEFRLYDEYETTIPANVSDLDTDVLTYKWEQLAGPTVYFDNPELMNPIARMDDSIEGDYEVTLKLTVSDQIDTVEKIIRVDVYGYNSEPIVDAGENRRVYYGDKVKLVSDAVDPEGKTLNYRWEYDGSIPLSLGSLDKPNLEFSIPASPDATQKVIRFVLFVSDGERETYDVVDLTVLPKEVSINEQNRNKKKSGGAFYHLWILLLLAIRKRFNN